MFGHQVKRGVTSTLERVFQASGQKLAKLEVVWTGKTAGIHFTRNDAGEVSASVIFPEIDETKFVHRDKFNNLVGFAVHELGHAWFTENDPWDKARETKGGYIHALINGLEDVRIEQAVIDSGYAENSRVLFEELVNAMLIEHGYVEPDDLQNVPFMLAIEGRRLNNDYRIVVPTILDRSPYADDIKWALAESKSAKNTKRIVGIAEELLKRLKQKAQAMPQQQQSKAGKGDGQGQGGEGGAGDGDADGNAQGNAQGDGQGEGNKPSKKPNKGGGYSNAFFDSDDFKGRRVEPDKFIQSTLKDVALNSKTNVPAVLKPKIVEFSFI